MEDDLKISKVEYLINHLLDSAQILNLSLDYPRNHCIDLDLWGGI